MNDQNRSRAYSARQRIVILTFDTPVAAEAWDAAGQPLGDDLVEYPHTVTTMTPADRADDVT